MAEALAGVADLLAVAVPSFGWAEGRRLLASSGSAAEINRYLERRPEHAAEDLMVAALLRPGQLRRPGRCPA